jgi:uncharacterized cofD-like protein
VTPLVAADRSVVALGGGHGLFASLSALRRVVERVTAVVTVADDGGSSGRLRREFGVLPPGDLRMALAALCGDDDWGQTWARVVQHRFAGDGDMRGHSLGNLLIVGLWELLGDHVAGLDLVGRLLGARGRVLPMSVTPLQIAAEVVWPETWAKGVVRGQVEVATTEGRITSVRLEPEDCKACPEAVEAVRTSDWVVMGPGSWFTSVVTHLLVPELREAIVARGDRLVVVLNLGQDGETDGFTAEDHLCALRDLAPDLRVHAVLVDPSAVTDLAALSDLVHDLGGRLVLEEVAADDGTPRHDPDRLALALEGIFEDGSLRG